MWEANGRPLDGWPKQLAADTGRLAISDISGDGVNEVILGTAAAGPEPTVVTAFDAAGVVLPGRQWLEHLVDPDVERGGIRPLEYRNVLHGQRRLELTNGGGITAAALGCARAMKIEATVERERRAE